MIPLYLSGCFGVLHPAGGGRGVLVCGPLGDEVLNAYRSLVFLAERAAEAGMPTLRLTWYGTGDSAGEDDEPDRLAQWLDNVHAGVNWLQQQCGVTRVTLIGHRIGAALAARAGCHIEAVDSLVLLAPIGGRQFLHELTLAARIAQRVWQTDHRIDDGTWFEAGGLRIDHATRDALNMLDPGKLSERPAQHALMLQEPERRTANGLAEALKRVGTAVTRETHEDLSRMVRESYEARIPQTALTSIAQWLRSLPKSPVQFPRTALQPDLLLELEASRESPIQLGPRADAFGILTTPRRRAADVAAVLLVNTGANPRFGNARFAVDLARSLAHDGVMSLRIDAAGMGDAALCTGELGRPYTETVTGDVLQGVAELARRAQRPVVVVGVCSGAYHALQAAARDQLVHGLILVNLSRFVWREGDPPDLLRRIALRPNRFYIRNLISAQAWSRLIRADFDSVATLARVFASRVLRRGLATLDPVIGLLPGVTTRVGGVRRTVQALGDRGVPILYMLGRNDPGVEELAEYFGRNGRRLQRQPNVTVCMLQGADHTLSAHTVRAALIERIRVWCQVNATRETAVKSSSFLARRWRLGWSHPGAASTLR
jgi:alpha-beta hydrolase superfamily lysophospholipase